MAERARMVALVPAAGGGRRFGGEAHVREEGLGREAQLPPSRAPEAREPPILGFRSSDLPVKNLEAVAVIREP